jgi:hypothetical protein
VCRRPALTLGREEVCERSWRDSPAGGEASQEGRITRDENGIGSLGKKSAEVLVAGSSAEQAAFNISDLAGCCYVCEDSVNLALGETVLPQMRCVKHS